MTDNAETFFPADDLDTFVRERRGLPESDHDGHMFIQWKGTNVCMDVACPACGHDGHIDDDFCYYLKCGGCGAVWQLGYAVSMTRVEESEASNPRLILSDEQEQETAFQPESFLATLARIDHPAITTARLMTPEEWDDMIRQRVKAQSN